MVMKINDPTSFFSSIQLKKSQQAISSSLAKIASGSRITKAADDASGLTIADRMESQLRGFGQSIRNANDAISMTQIADGALEGATSILQEMRVKAIQASSDSQSFGSRQALQAEFSRSLASLNQIMGTTSFNGQKLLDGNFGNQVFSGGEVTDPVTSSPSSSLNFTTDLTLATDTATTVDSVVAAGSTLKAGTTMQAGSSLGFNLTDAEMSGNITTTEATTLAAGTTLGEGSVLAAGTEVGGNVTLGAGVTTNDQSTLASGSTLAAGSVLAQGTVVTTGFTSGGTTYAAGDVLNSDVSLDTDLALTAEMTAASGSTLAQDSVAAAGSQVAADVTTKGTTTFNLNTDLATGSVIADTAGTSLQNSSVVGGNVQLAADVDLIRDMNLEAGSTMAAQSELAEGSTPGGALTTDIDLTMAEDMTLAAGSSLEAGTVITAGTVLTNDITGQGGQIFEAGQTLGSDITTEGVNYLGNAQTMAGGSTLAAGSVIGQAEAATTTTAQTGTQEGSVPQISLSEVDLTSQQGAQDALAVIDAALQDIGTQRAEFGSRQNQYASEIENLRNSMVNLAAAKSSVADVDLVEEIMNLSQNEALNKARMFAMAQTGNISKMNIMDLLQG